MATTNQLRILPMLLLLLASIGCRRSDPPAAAPPPPLPALPTRGAVGDDDLRVMLAEVASAKACTGMRGTFMPLRDKDRADVTNGVLWIRDCAIAQHGTHVTFTLGGDGWQWAQQSMKKAGGTFALAQYVKFHVTASIPGALDVAYAPSSHVVSLWFTPEREPDVTFAPIGGFDVDERGVWSSVIGGASTLFGSSPDAQASSQARAQGTDAFTRQLARGLGATVDLCTGLARFGLGAMPRGVMMPPNPGDSHRAPIDLRGGGVMPFGPFPAPHGFTAVVDTRHGAAHVALVCDRDASVIAGAFASDLRARPVRALAEKTISGHATLHARAAGCPVVVVVSAIAPNAPEVEVDWQRPPAEAGAALGGPMVECARGR